MNPEEKESSVDFTIDDGLDRGSTMILEGERGATDDRCRVEGYTASLIDDTALSLASLFTLV